MVNNSPEEIRLPAGTDIIVRTSEPGKYVTCEVCGAKNEVGRELCRVCSNYLEEDDKHEK